MASYKVAQDVEADDKLLGPFGFRQFIYLIIVAMAGFLGYGLWNLFPPLAILPAPIVILFGALALPLRKDQPMETYLAAMVSFYLKPRKRLWNPDGVEHIVEITAPKTADESLTKAYGAGEADRRLSYLADIADSRGWAIRHAAMPAAGTTSMISDIYNEAQATQDILDDSGNIAQNIDSLINKSDDAHRQKIINSLHAPQPMPAQPVTLPAIPAWQQAAMPAQQNPSQTFTIPAATPQLVQPDSRPSETNPVQYNPYPSIHQSMIQPVQAQQPAPKPQQQAQQPARQSSVTAPQRQQQPQTPPQRDSAPSIPQTPQRHEESTSDTPVSPDIMNLANNSKNLSVETIAHEAKRLHKGKDDEEVVISLR